MKSKILLGKKRAASAMRIPQDIPEVDSEQEAAAFKMYEDGAALLFSDPGAGKTLTALVALDYVQQHKKQQGALPAKVLILCPTIAVRNWATWTVAMAEQCNSPVTVQIIRSAADPINLDANVLIVTYGLISRKGSALPPMLRMWGAEVLICDESDNLNGKESNRTDVVLNDRTGLAVISTWAWFLTGTPIPRYQDGLWPVLNCRFKERLAQFSVQTYTRFVDMFCFTKLVKHGHMRFPKEQICGNRNTNVMHDLLYSGYPIAVRNKLTLKDKPLFREVTLDFAFSKEFLALEKRMADAQLEADEFGEPTGEANSELVTALRMLGTEAAPHVADYVVNYRNTRLEQGEGVLVLFWHRAVGDALLQHFADHGVQAAMIRGDTSQNKRDNLVDLFCAGKLPVLVGQIASMGVALNLQKSCRTVVFAEETFSDAANRQAYQRVWRRGQERVVDVIYCRTLSDLSDIKPSVAERKAKGAAAALDGNS